MASIACLWVPDLPLVAALRAEPELIAAPLAVVQAGDLGGRARVLGATAPVQQAPLQQAPLQQAPAQQAPLQQAPLQQAPLPQVLFGVTVTFPEVEPHVTVIDVVPCPAVMLAPLGTVQL